MKDTKQYKAEQELVEILNGETIGNAKMLMDGMGKEIDRLLERDQSTVPLSDLKTEWL